MASIRLASRYAKSLIDLAKEREKVDEVYTDMTALQQILGNKDLLLFLKSPILTSEKKSEVFKVLFEGKISDISYKFLQLLIKKGRESALPEIVSASIQQIRALKNIVPVKITTAVLLDEQTMKAIEHKLKETNTVNAQLLMTNEVKPDIIGGFQIEFEDKLIDASLAHKLDLIRRELDINLYESKIRSI